MGRSSHALVPYSVHEEAPRFHFIAAIAAIAAIAVIAVIAAIAAIAATCYHPPEVSEQ